MEYRFIYITCRDNTEALAIGRKLVLDRLAACANIQKEIASIYWWNGELVEDKETALVLKTTSGKVESLIRAVKEMHSYEVPCIVSLPILEGNPDYLSWIHESVNT
jgi:periplasmic divalent cation tolerance protein